MDEKAMEALTALANNLGTTAEYLWDVLLRQAPITGVINLAMMASWVVLTVMWCKFVLRKTTAPKPTDEKPTPQAEWREEAAIFAWFSAVALVLITALSVTVNFPTTLAALINPEYWALRKILK